MASPAGNSSVSDQRLMVLDNAGGNPPGRNARSTEPPVLQNVARHGRPKLSRGRGEEPVTPAQSEPAQGVLPFLDAPKHDCRRPGAPELLRITEQHLAQNRQIVIVTQIRFELPQTSHP